MTHNAEYVCPICRDRGWIGYFHEYCNCEMGKERRREAEAQERAQEPPPEGQMPLTWENAGTVDVREASDD